MIINEGAESNKLLHSWHSLLRFGVSGVYPNTALKAFDMIIWGMLLVFRDRVLTAISVFQHWKSALEIVL